jgi:hypothetical protein
MTLITVPLSVVPFSPFVSSIGFINPNRRNLAPAVYYRLPVLSAGWPIYAADPLFYHAAFAD